MTGLLFVLTALACVLIYLSCKRQIWLTKPLTLIWRRAGYLLALVALIGFCATRTPSSALFFWLLSGMVTFGLLPFFRLNAKEAADGRC